MSVSNVGVELTSPEYPRPYPNNLHCVTNIRLEEDQKIALRFVEFELDNSFWDDWWVMNCFAYSISLIMPYSRNKRLFNKSNLNFKQRLAWGLWWWESELSADRQQDVWQGARWQNFLIWQWIANTFSFRWRMYCRMHYRI